MCTCIQDSYIIIIFITAKEMDIRCSFVVNNILSSIFFLSYITKTCDLWCMSWNKTRKLTALKYVYYSFSKIFRIVWKQRLLILWKRTGDVWSSILAVSTWTCTCKIYFTIHAYVNEIYTCVLQLTIIDMWGKSDVLSSIINTPTHIITMYIL